jgi:hypothetical protein
MSTKNVTLAIPTSLYNEALAYAQKKGLSLNAMIRELLTKETKPTTSAWIDEMFDVMDSTPKASKKYKWNRDEIYE